jgi:hypothetical protein
MRIEPVIHKDEVDWFKCDSPADILRRFIYALAVYALIYIIG